jgi:hypothetical protein
MWLRMAISGGPRRGRRTVNCSCKFSCPCDRSDRLQSKHRNGLGDEAQTGGNRRKGVYAYSKYFNYNELIGIFRDSRRNYPQAPGWAVGTDKKRFDSVLEAEHNSNIDVK